MTNLPAKCLNFSFINRTRSPFFRIRVDTSVRGPPPVSIMSHRGPRAVLVLMLVSFARAFVAPRFVRHPSATIAASSSAGATTRLMASTGRSRSEDFQSVLSEIIGVIRNTGPRPGVVRTLQVAGAVKGTRSVVLRVDDACAGHRRATSPR